MRDFRTLRVWQHGHRFVLDVYGVTRAFPVDERQGLTAQLRRAAASITSTLAEGAGAFSDADQRRFFRMAFRSSCEALNHLILARDLEYLCATDYAHLEAALESIRKMLWRLIERSQDRQVLGARCSVLGAEVGRGWPRAVGRRPMAAKESAPREIPGGSTATPFSRRHRPAQRAPAHSLSRV